MFPTKFTEILQRIDLIDPVAYGKTRNYVDGTITQLSPYISRGVISTKLVFDQTIRAGYSFDTIEKFIQELAWRDYWQQVWIAKGDQINSDLKNRQHPVSNFGLSLAIKNASTGITAIDLAIANFYKTGYLHNHMRMYIAALCCNMAQSHWKIPAQWMYYHLLDADWASNALSWQWVAGTNSHKKYYANQENINKYFYTHQKNTFLDVSYHAFNQFPIPDVLREIETVALQTLLPTYKLPTIRKELPTYVYNFYNLDPHWGKNTKANRILLLEPSHFKTYPISQQSLDFMLQLAENIEGIQIFVGEFSEMVDQLQLHSCNYKEHPLSKHYKGEEHPRDWMFEVHGYFPSFFSFWKQCKKQLRWS